MRGLTVSKFISGPIYRFRDRGASPHTEGTIGKCPACSEILILGVGGFNWGVP